MIRVNTNNNMNNFVKIQTFYNQVMKRDITEYQKLYSDINLLKESIFNIISDELYEDKIKGKRILLKPNWVRHSLNQNDDICLRTNNNFLLATLELLLDLKPRSIIIGDAPIQQCNWDKVVTNDLLEEIRKLSVLHNIEILVEDFRRVIFNPMDNKLSNNIRPLEDYLIFDLGEKSLLEPVSNAKKNLFRVTYYNPDRLAESHSLGRHKYCITKRLFDVDVIISLPKVKTHQKSGITAALKNLVGVNGDKDYLPHHRLGGTERGGDCYPGKNPLRYYAELLRDVANRNKGKGSYWIWLKMSSMLWKLSFPGKEHHLGAAWYGNDTTWRMVMDLNKIVLYGKEDGTLSDSKQRILYSLCDGIIGGQGDGPLFPKPLPLGIISFTNHSLMNDVCMGLLMGFDIEKIPLLNYALKTSKNDKVKILVNNEEVNCNNLKKLSVDTIPPPGWLNYSKK